MMWEPSADVIEFYDNLRVKPKLSTVASACVEVKTLKCVVWMETLLFPSFKGIVQLNMKFLSMQ